MLIGLKGTQLIPLFFTQLDVGDVDTKHLGR